MDMSSSLSVLRAELEALKPRALQRRAESEGVEEALLEEAEDDAAVVALIVQARAAVWAGQLRMELRALKPRALQRRAEAEGVGERQLEEAEDAEAIVALIVERVLGSGGRAAAEEEAARLAQLEQELLGFKPRALNKRAEEVGVAEDRLDAADDDRAIVALILEACAARAPHPSTPPERPTPASKRVGAAAMMAVAPPPPADIDHAGASQSVKQLRRQAISMGASVEAIDAGVYYAGA
jgi:hypothetical protein